MNEETAIKDHWAIDFHFTEQNNLNEYVSFAKEVVSGDLKVLSNLASDNKVVDNSNIIDNEFENPNFFLIPEYSKTFALQKRNKYTAKTQKWIGYVLEIKQDDRFTAQLQEINNPTTIEIGEFDKLDILPDDIPLLSIGATFYWSIGYLTDNSQRKRESTIKFRRLGEITTNDIDRIEDDADNLFKSINWEK